MLVKTHCAAVTGLEAVTVTIEVNIVRGTNLHFSGLADVSVRESIDRIRAAMSNTGYKFPSADITINMAPADLKKEGSGYDLPLAVAILAAENKVNTTLLGDYMLVGEIGLDGRLCPSVVPCPSPSRQGQRSSRGSSYPAITCVRRLLSTTSTSMA